MNRFLLPFVLTLCGAASLLGQTASGEALRHATELRLFGVEIGGPEDGFSLTNRLHFESAQRTEANFIDLRPIWSTLEPTAGKVRLVDVWTPL